MKTTIALFLTTCVAAFCWLAPIVSAISPPPDGAYPAGNTAEGQSALFSLTSGGYNTAIGFFSLRSDATNSFNTAIGAGTLLANMADENTATGAGALLSNTTGSDNTANGAFALFTNTEGIHNTAIGLQALLHNTTGADNTASGLNALVSNTIGNLNTANGSQALFHNTTGILNTAIGADALSNNVIGSSNTAVGIGALFSNTGNSNTAVGDNALSANTLGDHNTAVGLQALFNNTTGGSNVAVGVNAGTGVTTASNVICIGAQGANVSNSCYIGNIFGATSGGAAVLISSDGKLGTNTSSQRFKDDIKPMHNASEVLYALKPVTFRYKKEIDPEGRSQCGLVAEDVEKINPDLIVRDKEGKPYSVRYDQVNAMLLNEFIKEHKTFVEQQRQISEFNSRVAKQEALIAQQRREFQAMTRRQENEIQALTATLKQQAAQIQKVSVAMNMGSSAPQMIAQSR